MNLEVKFIYSYLLCLGELDISERVNGCTGYLKSLCPSSVYLDPATFTYKKHRDRYTVQRAAASLIIYYGQKQRVKANEIKI